MHTAHWSQDTSEPGLPGLQQMMEQWSPPSWPSLVSVDDKNKSTLGGRSLSGLHFLITSCHWGLQAAQRQKLNHTEEDLSAGLLSMACSPCYGTLLRTTFLCLALPTVGEALLFPLAVKKCPLVPTGPGWPEWVLSHLGYSWRLWSQRGSRDMSDPTRDLMKLSYLQ